MASVYTNDLRLEEIGSGEQSGTWGDTTNTNLELIAEGFSFGTEAITTNADTHTSTVADGATDPARSMYIKYTGTLDSTCTITIAPNTLSRMHFIENGTSGSQDIIISQGSGANVTIPPGDVKAVYLDGAGSGAAVVDAFASLNVGALTVLNGASTITTADNTAQLTLASTDTDANVGPVLDLNRNVTGADDDNLGSITFTAKDDAGNAQTFAKIDTSIRDASNSTEASRLNFHVASNGSVTKFLGFIGQTASAGAGTTFNEDGNDVDFRIESDTKPNAFSLNGATGSVGFNVLDGDVTNDGTAARTYVGIIGTANRGRLNLGTTASNGADAGTLAFTNGANTLVSFSTDTTSGVQNTGTLNILGTRSIKIQAAASDEVVINEDSNDIDFRVESNGNANMLFVDGGNDVVVIGSTVAENRLAQKLAITNAGDRGGMTINSFFDSTSAPIFDFQKGKSNNAGSHAVVAENDGLGAIIFRGDDGDEFHDSSAIAGDVDGTPGNGDMPGRLRFFTTADGASAMTERMRIGNDGNVNIGSSSNFVASRLHVNGTKGDSSGTLTNQLVVIDEQAFSTTGNGGAISFGGDFYDGGQTVFGTIQGIKENNTDSNYASAMTFSTRANGGNLTEAARIDSTLTLLVATTDANPGNNTGSAKGAVMNFEGKMVAAAYQAEVAVFNRMNNDGTIVDLRQNGSSEGSISVSGTTVSYNAFSGSHWSRLADNSQPTILKGTVVENIDTMMDWYEATFTIPATDESEEIGKKVAIELPAGKTVGDTMDYVYKDVTYIATIILSPDNKHTYCKISDTADSIRVYGVFAAWDNDDDTVNDMYVTAVGTHVVRVHSGQTVAGGDLIVSNGDGTAKKQSDDVVRSKTIGKVLTNIKQETYADGSYTVPCALYCG